MKPDEPGFRPGGTKGGLLGCLVALGFVPVASMPFLFALAWGGAHCEPVPQCQRSAELIVLIALAGVLALAALLGFAVRALFNWWMWRRYDPAAAGRPPIWAVAVVAILGSAFAWSLGAFWIAPY